MNLLVIKNIISRFEKCLDFDWSAWNCLKLLNYFHNKSISDTCRNKISQREPTFLYDCQKTSNLEFDIKINFMAKQLCWIILDCTCVSYKVHKYYIYIYHSCKVLENRKNAPLKCLKSAWIRLWKRSRNPVSKYNNEYFYFS